MGLLGLSGLERKSSQLWGAHGREGAEGAIKPRIRSLGLLWLLLRGRASQLLARWAITMARGASVARAPLMLWLRRGWRRPAERRKRTHALAVAMPSRPSLIWRGSRSVGKGACPRALEDSRRRRLVLDSTRRRLLCGGRSHSCCSVRCVEKLTMLALATTKTGRRTHMIALVLGRPCPRG